MTFSTAEQCDQQPQSGFFKPPTQNSHPDTTMSLFNPSSFDWPSSEVPAPPPDDQSAPNSGSPPESSLVDQDTTQQSLPASSPDGTVYEDAEEGEPDRPNKWRGSSEKYKALIADARQTKDSLDRLNDQEWGAHLFNVHGLKRGVYPDVLGSSAVGQKYEEWMRKERLYEDEGWFPHRSWTAWPLLPGVVPRRDERMLWDRHRNGDVADVKQAFKARLEEKPSQELEELLLAEFTKQARTRFEEREWDVDRESSSEDEEEPAQPAPAPGKRKRPDDGDTVDDSDKRKRFKKTGKQETGATLVNRSGTPLENEMLQVTFKPVVLADDDDACFKVQPMINSIVDSLDSLLTALHHSRMNQIPSSKPANVSLEDLLLADKSRSTSPASNTMTNTSDVGFAVKQTRRAHRTRAQHACRPRDWSEVLGMAAIVGFDTKVIHRTQARCEALFAERMTFRNVDSDSYQILSEPATLSITESKEQFLDGVHLDNFMQPIPRYHTARRYKHRKTPARRRDSNTSDITSATSRASTADSDEDEEESMECTNCGINHTTRWRRDPGTRKRLCNSCGVYLKRVGKHRPVDKNKTPAKECANCHTTKTSKWLLSKTNARLLCRKCYHEENRATIRNRHEVNNMTPTESCKNCGKPWTKGFRAGPDGPGTLCAACGVFWKRNGGMRPLERPAVSRQERFERSQELRKEARFRAERVRQEREARAMAANQQDIGVGTVT